MKKEEITSKELKQCICLKTGKLNFSEVTDEDIENITEIDLRGIKFNGEETDVILAELDAFPNLNGLLISHFDLKVEDIDAISRQDKLRVVQFSSCDFENIETINLPNLDVLVFVGCTDMGKLKMPKSRVLRVIGSELNFDGVDVNNIRAWSASVKLLHSKENDDVFGTNPLRSKCDDGSSHSAGGVKV